MDFEAVASACAAPATDAEAKQEAAKKAEPKILSVSDVNKAVKTTLENDYKTLWIKGEISNFKPHSSGHFYFALKDSKASINAVMFRGFNQGLRFKPHDGLEVIVRGKISVYEPRGTYQVFCEMMEPVGAGALQVAFDQLKRKLELEGLFAPARKRALPALPRHVAVVTSPTGAAIRDILNILNRRFKGLRVTVIPAVVQGAGAPDSICLGIANAQKLADVDVMIVGRGGGSIEDLWGFNDERVARAISGSRIPTISAVGHEIDFTIADFVADLRAPTPSAAAELVCKNAGEIQEQINGLKSRLWRALTGKFRMDRQLVTGLSKRLVDPKRRLLDLALRSDELAQRLEAGVLRYFETERQHVRLLAARLPSPRETILRRRQDVDMLQARLNGSMVRGLEIRQSRLGRLSALLDAVSPLKVLERGFSITRKDGELIKSSEQLQAGDSVEIALAKGSARARIESTVKS
ncbi:MAG: exodeoxyribonuclease VII large subunit [Bdellovibrionales bacterium]|nr:exodeoxyribonuclease VII large subunit [Bdellovibrionales bacterium]